MEENKLELDKKIEEIQGIIEENKKQSKNDLEKTKKKITRDLTDLTDQFNMALQEMQNKIESSAKSQEVKLNQTKKEQEDSVNASMKKMNDILADFQEAIDEKKKELDTSGEKLEQIYKRHEEQNQLELEKKIVALQKSFDEEKDKLQDNFKSLNERTEKTDKRK